MNDELTSYKFGYKSKAYLLMWSAFDFVTTYFPKSNRDCNIPEIIEISAS